MKEDKNLSEDIAFSNFLKANLEKGVAVSPSTISAILSVARAETEQQKRTPLYGSWLKAATLFTAACLMLICRISLFTRTDDEIPFRENAIANRRADEQIVQVIELLNETEGLSLEKVDTMDTADLLLAWQDAPYKHLENEFVNQVSF